MKQQTKHKHHSNMQPTKKTFQSITGQWIEKRTKTEILLCSCGNKYIKTRKFQAVCVRCIYRTLPIKTS